MSDSDDQRESPVTGEHSSVPDEAGARAPTVLQIAASVLAAAFGVQSNKNRERDFTQGNPVVFILAGLLFTLMFVLAIVGVVMLVLP